MTHNRSGVDQEGAPLRSANQQQEPEPSRDATVSLDETRRELDIAAIKERRNAVMRLNFALAADASKAYRMSIPARDDDADMLLFHLCTDVDRLCAAVEAGEVALRDAYIAGVREVMVNRGFDPSERQIRSAADSYVKTRRSASRSSLTVTP